MDTKKPEGQKEPEGEIKDPTVKKEELMHSFKTEKLGSFPTALTLILVVVVLAGIICGYGLAKVMTKTGTLPIATIGSSPLKGKTFGSKDTKTFKDTAEGVLKEGGIEGEGQYHLVRSGGDSQNVYMTSSSVDLSQFVNRKIKVWGQTQKAQTAGWLMDVGRVEVKD